MLTCRKTQMRESAAQWNLDALVETPGGDILPCFVAVLSSYCTILAPNTEGGEAIFGDVAGTLGSPRPLPRRWERVARAGGRRRTRSSPSRGR